jgi:gluconokinase
MIAILMGVTSSGKSTIAHELVALTGWKFAEGDDYHSEANRQKMHAGIPLTDEDRIPWLASLHEVILGWFRNGDSGVLTCSALKQSYRDQLVKDLPHDACRFVLLDVPIEVLRERISHRPGSTARSRRSSFPRTLSVLTPQKVLLPWRARFLLSFNPNSHSGVTRLSSNQSPFSLEKTFAWPNSRLASASS